MLCKFNNIMLYFGCLCFGVVGIAVLTPSNPYVYMLLLQMMNQWWDYKFDKLPKSVW